MSGLRGQPDWLKKIFPSHLKEILRLIFRKLVEWAWKNARDDQLAFKKRPTEWVASANANFSQYLMVRLS